MMPATSNQSNEAMLQAEIIRLNKIIDVLMDRAESGSNRLLISNERQPPE